MRFLPVNRWRSPVRRAPPAVPLPRDEDGSAAIEFGIIALPSCCSCSACSVLGCTSSPAPQLEYGAESAARKMRTGEAENGNMTVAGFKQLVCDGGGLATSTAASYPSIVHSARPGARSRRKRASTATASMVGSTGRATDMIVKVRGHRERGGAGHALLPVGSRRQLSVPESRQRRQGSGDHSGRDGLQERALQLMIPSRAHALRRYAAARSHRDDRGAAAVEFGSWRRC